MGQYNQGGIQDFGLAQSSSRVELRPLMRLVYLWMFFGLLTTAIVSSFIATSEGLVATIAPLVLPLFILEIFLVMGLRGALSRATPTMGAIVFFVYAAINGLTLGVLFWVYIANGQSSAIASAFFTTAGLFGAMTLVGYTTQVDLTKFSSFFLMALIGLFIALIVNMFMRSPALDYVISVVGVLLFTALTAYDTQRIKEMASLPEFSQYGDATTKMAIYGALILYLDFINLFIYLLRLFGRRN